MSDEAEVVRVTWGCDEGHEPFVSEAIGGDVLFYAYEHADNCPRCEVAGKENPAVVQRVETAAGEDLEFDYDGENDWLEVPRYA